MFGNYPTLLRGSGRLEKVIWQAYLTSTPKPLVLSSLKVFSKICLRDSVWRGSAMWRLSPLWSPSPRPRLLLAAGPGLGLGPPHCTFQYHYRHPRQLYNFKATTHHRRHDVVTSLHTFQFISKKGPGVSQMWSYVFVVWWEKLTKMRRGSRRNQEPRDLRPCIFLPYISIAAHLYVETYQKSSSIYYI